MIEILGIDGDRDADDDSGEAGSDSVAMTTNWDTSALSQTLPLHLPPRVPRKRVRKGSVTSCSSKTSTSHTSNIGSKQLVTQPVSRQPAQQRNRRTRAAETSAASTTPVKRQCNGKFGDSGHGDVPISPITPSNAATTTVAASANAVLLQKQKRRRGRNIAHCLSSPVQSHSAFDENASDNDNISGGIDGNSDRVGRDQYSYLAAGMMEPSLLTMPFCLPAISDNDSFYSASEAEGMEHVDVRSSGKRNSRKRRKTNDNITNVVEVCSSGSTAESSPVLALMHITAKNQAPRHAALSLSRAQIGSIGEVYDKEVHDDDDDDDDEDIAAIDLRVIEALKEAVWRKNCLRQAAFAAATVLH